MVYKQFSIRFRMLFATKIFFMIKLLQPKSNASAVATTT